LGQCQEILFKKEIQMRIKLNEVDAVEVLTLQDNYVDNDICDPMMPYGVI
jgi:hypothetical protein